jgi:branched-chain amino acid transport system permease protein
MAIEVVALRTLYSRDHLDQVLCTFGLILLLNDVVRMIWGPMPLRMSLPEVLAGSINLFGIQYPTFRLAIILVGMVVGLFLYYLIGRTKVGMLIRAGASDRMMIGALGVNIRLLFTLIFALGAALAGLAGVMAGPLLSVQVGMGDHILILTLVVIVIGGIGSVRGAFVGALLVGFIDTAGRVMLPPALAEMAIYALMAIVLLSRPQGLLAARA